MIIQVVLGAMGVCAKELAKLVAAVGRKGIWYVKGLEVPVEIVDVKKAYGSVRYLIKTSLSDKAQWVDAGNVKLTSEVVKGAFRFIKDAVFDAIF